jgi:hypothetical protein
MQAVRCLFAMSITMVISIVIMLPAAMACALDSIFFRPSNHKAKAVRIEDRRRI